jgi:hypothetical protein
MTDEELEAIQKRADAATPGPWSAFTDPARRADQSLIVAPPPEYGLIHVQTHKDFASLNHDATFIAHAREDIPKLLAEVRRLRDENEQLSKSVEFCVSKHGLGG